MKLFKIKLTAIIGLFLAIITFSSCSQNDEITQDKIDLSNIELKGILDYNTKITKSTIQNESSTLTLMKLLNEAKSISKSEKNKYNDLKFYFKNNYLYASREHFTYAPIDDGGGGDDNDCGNWTHCKTCRSESCVTDFIKDMADRYNCFEVRVHRRTFSANLVIKSP
ncbi:MAG: hypothetical protein GKR88_03980 [Flavobacteriaceae bacterium]|nr:MAG: hypothetical protein GKR88_03980 [Flavobacteriaceae bacterium]